MCPQDRMAVGRPRGWDNDRLFQTVVEMFRNGSLSSAEVVDPIVDFGASARAFMDILGDPSEAVKLGIRF